MKYLITLFCALMIFFGCSDDDAMNNQTYFPSMIRLDGGGDFLETTFSYNGNNQLTGIDYTDSEDRQYRIELSFENNNIASIVRYNELEEPIEQMDFVHDSFGVITDLSITDLVTETMPYEFSVQYLPPFQSYNIGINPQIDGIGDFTFQVYERGDLVNTISDFTSSSYTYNDDFKGIFHSINHSLLELNLFIEFFLEEDFLIEQVGAFYNFFSKNQLQQVDFTGSEYACSLFNYNQEGFPTFFEGELNGGPIDYNINYELR